MNGADFVALWDSGRGFTTVEMGGIGPGYEQTIQTLVVELVRDNLGKPLPTGTRFDGWGDDTIARIDAQLGGVTGAMYGAARNLAFRILRDGYQPTIDAVKREGKADRLIQVSSFWPKVTR